MFFNFHGLFLRSKVRQFTCLVGLIGYLPSALMAQTSQRHLPIPVPIPPFPGDDSLEWSRIMTCLQTVDENTSFEELSQCCLKLYNLMKKNGLIVPEFSEVLEEVKGIILEKHPEIDVEEMNQVAAFLLEKQQGHSSCRQESSPESGPPRNYRHHKHHKHKHHSHSQIYVTDDMAEGFVYVLGGLLCLLVPLPFSAVVSGVLLGHGVTKLSADMIAKSAEKKRREEAQAKSITLQQAIKGR